MKILLPIVVLSLHALLSFGEEMQCEGPWIYDTEEDVKRLVMGANLVVIGKPISVEYGCRRSTSAFADLRIEVKEIWAGSCPREISIRVSSVYNVDLECARRVNQCLPRDFLDGDNYLFLLSGKWDRDLRQFTEGYDLPLCGMMKYDYKADEVCFLSSEYIMGLQDSGEFIREQLGQLTPPMLYKAADLVVIVENLRNDVTQEELSFSNIQDPVSGKVIRVLKGEWDSQTLSFYPRGIVYRRSPLLDTAERVLLFLQESEGGYYLESGQKGYNVLKNGEILDSAKKPTGWGLDDHGIARIELFR